MMASGGWPVGRPRWCRTPDRPASIRPDTSVDRISAYASSPWIRLSAPAIKGDAHDYGSTNQVRRRRHSARPAVQDPAPGALRLQRRQHGRGRSASTSTSWASASPTWPTSSRAPDGRAEGEAQEPTPAATSRDITAITTPSCCSTSRSWTCCRGARRPRSRSTRSPGRSAACRRSATRRSG